MSSPSRDEIVSFLRSRILQRIGLPESELDNTMVLSDLGMTSLDAVLISGEIEERYDIEVDPLMMFECRTVDAVADRIVTMLS